MYAIELEWKEFSFCLETVRQFLVDNAGEHFAGLAANYKLVVYFSQEPSQEIKDLVQTYYSLIDEASPEALAYCSEASKKAAIEALKAGIAEKTWDTMSVAERKIVLNQTPTKAELGL